MGKHVHHQCCRQLRIWQDFSRPGHHPRAESTLGRDPIYGNDSIFNHESSLLTPPKDSFYKPLSPEQSESAFRNEYDFDSPDAIDFDVLVERLRDIKDGFVSHLRQALLRC